MSVKCSAAFGEIYCALCNFLASLGSAVVAVSGGADSSLLLKAALDALGKENVVSVAVQTEVTIKRELNSAKSFCDSLGIALNVIGLPLLSNPSFANNPPNRCYICKRAMFTAIKDFASQAGISCILEGTNASDCIKDRPGFAAITELGILSPLRECGITKADVRKISKELSLSTWNTPSNSCLATRFPFNELLTKERLSLVEKAEEFLVSGGITSVRVKVGGGNE